MAEPTDKTKRPASQYYWGDWWKDKGLHSCSLTARGLWHEMNCLMHEGEPYGHLTLNGRPMTMQQLANQCRITPAVCKKLVDELLAAGVPSKDAERGTLYSRRMVRDEAVREARAAGGKGGAEHGAKGAEHGSKGGRPPGPKGGEKTPLPPAPKPPPSSSSSSSSSPSGGDQPADAGLQPAEPPAAGAKPQLTLVEPAAPSEPPPCPQRRLVALFAERCPDLPKPRIEAWEESAGAEAMRHRWKWLFGAVRESGERYATTVEEGVAWFGRFFDAVQASDFLSGRNGAWDKCNLAWLMKRENFIKVLDGLYDNKAGRAAR